MRKQIYFVLSLLALALAAAQVKADSIQLNDIDTNDCVKAQKEVSLLNVSGITISSQCSAYSPSGYSSSQGKQYDYRLTSYLTVDGDLPSGTTIQLNDIDTNNCAWAQSEIVLLSSPKVQVEAQCSPYSQGGYKSSSGRYYDYRLYTTITIL
jgi:hypothetical protein